jgi:hypothetical protein
MAFEPRVVEARLALNLISSTEMPRLAWEALEAGLDGPAIRRLAAFEFPTFFQVREVLPQAMEEMRLARLDKAGAALQLAKLRAQEILATNLDPFKHLRDLSTCGLRLTIAGNCRATEILMTRSLLRGPWDNLNRKFVSGSWKD